MEKLITVKFYLLVALPKAIVEIKSENESNPRKVIRLCKPIHAENVKKNIKEIFFTLLIYGNFHV